MELAGVTTDRALEGEDPASPTDPSVDRDLFRLCMQKAPTLWCSVSARTGRVVEISDRALRTLERSRDSVVGQSVLDLYHPASRMAAQDALRAFQQDGHVQDAQLALTGADGSPVPVRLDVESIRGEDGTILRSISVWTPEARSTIQRDEHEARLEEANARLQQFAYIASHDLKEPLRTMRSFCQLLANDLEDRLEEEPRKWMAFIQDGAERMHQMLDGLLAYSRASTHGARLQDLSLDICLGNALANLAPRIQESGAVITRRALPTVSVDPAQATTILQNLVSNALKFVAPGQVPEIHVDAEEYDQVVHIRVHDRGIGIEERFRTKVFQVFSRIHPVSRYPGAGIGLATCQRLAERHGGRLDFTSTPGQGTTFILTLPRTGTGTP